MNHEKRHFVRFGSLTRTNGSGCFVQVHLTNDDPVNYPLVLMPFLTKVRIAEGVMRILRLRTDVRRAILLLWWVAFYFAVGNSWAADSFLFASWLAPTSIARGQGVITVTSRKATIAQDRGCTLQEAVLNANANRKLHRDCAAGRGRDRIQFKIPGPAPHTILLGKKSEIVITDELVLDGLTQPPQGGTAAACGPKRALLIELDGSRAGTATGITVLDTENVTIRGFNIHSFAGSGIQIHDSKNVTVQCNNIGTDLAGNRARPNARSGIQISNGSQTVLIGTDGDGNADEFEYNVISGNNGSGVLINGSSYNLIAGNRIGTNEKGTRAVRNTGAGVQIFNGSVGNLVGTDSNGVADDVERNVISGNKSHGLSIFGVGTDINQVAGNFIGTNIFGERVVANAVAGVNVTGGAKGTIIGGEAPSDQNVVSGNDSRGIWIHTDYDQFAGGMITSDTTVQNNRIGLKVSGNPMRNKNQGILVELAANTVVVANIVAENSARGIYVVGAEATILDNIIVNNNLSGIEVTFAHGPQPLSDGNLRTSNDVISSVDIKRNIVEGNCRSGERICAGILGIDDSVDPDDTTKGIFLSRANIINTNNRRPDIAQFWYAAARVQHDHSAIAEIPLVIKSSNGGPNYALRTTAQSSQLFDSSILRGPEGFSVSDLSSWQLFRDFIVKADGTPVTYQVHTIASEHFPLVDNGATLLGMGTDFDGQGVSSRSHEAFEVANEPFQFFRYKIIPLTVPMLSLLAESTVIEGEKVAVSIELNVPLTIDVSAVVSLYNISVGNRRVGAELETAVPLLNAPIAVDAGGRSSTVEFDLPSSLSKKHGGTYLIHITHAENAFGDGKPIIITQKQTAEALSVRK